jgi:hypothetical protein
MDGLTFIVIVVVMVLAVGGVWGLAILQGLMRQRALKLESRGSDPRIGELLEGHHQLETRLDQIEEEVTFFRELHSPKPPRQIESPEDERT